MDDKEYSAITAEWYRQAEEGRKYLLRLDEEIQKCIFEYYYYQFHRWISTDGEFREHFVNLIERSEDSLLDPPILH